MRLIFLFTREGAAGKDATYDPSVPSGNHFAVNEGGLKSEGYMWLLHRMKETKVVDDILIFIESNRRPGLAHIYGIPIHVVPNIHNIDSYMEPEDVIWVRGGFRSWHEWLAPKKGKHWLLLYAADTGREKWLFWDIIFSDIGRKSWIDARGRLWVEFHKPIHPKIFYPIACDPEYDICIGASHIHDKKGQWKTIQSIIQYEKMYRKKLKCVMPGRLMRGVNTRQIPKVITENNLDVKVPGMVGRKIVNQIYNKSKLFVYLGGGGQNDRGPLEALCCGTPIIICNPAKHHEVCYLDSTASEVCENHMDFKMVAQKIHLVLNKRTEDMKTLVHKYFEAYNGIETVCLPEMKSVFDVIRKNPIPNKEALEEILNAQGTERMV
jgi:glycosyltransferase involved in cell wall biosynthesis